MATRGRKPKPTVLHELHGTLNATRHAARTHEIEAPGEPLHEPPDWMTESQKDGWRYAIAHAPRNLLKPIDRTVLAIWVEAEDRHRRAAVAQAALDARSPTFPLLVPSRRGKGGDLVESPYVRVLSRAADTLLRAVSELGFSPASRPRIMSSPAKPADEPASPWARMQLLQGGKGPGAA